MYFMPARATWFAVPATGPTRLSNQAPAVATALRSASAEARPAAKNWASLARSPAVRSISTRNLQPKPWHTKTDSGVGGATEYSAKVAATTRGLVAPIAIEVFAASATQATT